MLNSRENKMDLNVIRHASECLSLTLLHKITMQKSKVHLWPANSNGCLRLKSPEEDDLTFSYYWSISVNSNGKLRQTVAGMKVKYINLNVSPGQEIYTIKYLANDTIFGKKNDHKTCVQKNDCRWIRYIIDKQMLTKLVSLWCT